MSESNKEQIYKSNFNVLVHLVNLMYINTVMIKKKKKPLYI
jgi:hypothetical protein